MSGALPELCLLPSAASSPRAIRPFSAPLLLWQAVRSQLPHSPLSCPRAPPPGPPAGLGSGSPQWSHLSHFSL